MAALVGGAEALVRGASGIAVRTGLSPVVVGLTVVAFGTSTPELAVSAGAALGGSADVALGNVVGSNIANVLLVLGLAALVGALRVAQRIVRIDVPIMIGASAAVAGLAVGGRLARWEGLLLVGALVAYTAWTVRTARADARRAEAASVTAEYAEAIEPLGRTSVASAALLVAGGLIGLVVGARWLVTSASGIASAFGVSDLVIGLTVVAVGTSAPEVATSVLAAIRGERDLAVGNAVGSNLFNLLGVLGIAAAVSPSGIPVSDQALTFDLVVMLAAAVACLPIFLTGFTLERWEGAAFLGAYAAYVAYLVLGATDSPAEELLGTAVVFFAAPLVLVTAVAVWLAGRRRAAP